MSRYVLRTFTRFTPLHRGGFGAPLVCLHGFLDTWRTWELVLPALERQHDVLALTLPGHAGGPTVSDEIGIDAAADAVAQLMDEARFPTAHIVGNSLGGFLALQLAARGRADSVVAFAPAGGWPADDRSLDELLAAQETTVELVRATAPYAEAIVATSEGRRRVTELITTRFEHIPAELLAHLLIGAAGCEGAAMLERAAHESWQLDAERITCPVRVVWGTEDRVLPWPSAATRFREEWLPHADWVLLEGTGHCPQLDVPLETGQLIIGFTATPG